MIGNPLTFPEIFNLPLAVDLKTAARAIGVCYETARRMIHDDRFPCPVLRVGRVYRIPTYGLMIALGVEIVPVMDGEMESAVLHTAELLEVHR